jgi:uncharacterized membrane protein YgaE (UPF0421/DUF939 family)
MAILGIEVTKKKGLNSAWRRIAASMLGLLFAWLLFWLFGFHVWVTAVFILGLTPLLTKINMGEGIVASSIVMFHMYSAQSVEPWFILNEIGILLVGLGTSTLINIVYMPRSDKDLQQLRTKIENSFSAIFKEISLHLKDATHIWSGNELLDAHQAIEEGTQLAKRTIENALFHADTQWLIYFEMRKTQLDSINRMLQLVAQVYETLPHGEWMAVIFEELSEDVKVEYYTGRSEAELTDLENKYKQMPLPSTRQEFEIRSALLQLCMELRTYLSIARTGQEKNTK